MTAGCFLQNRHEDVTTVRLASVLESVKGVRLVASQRHIASLNGHTDYVYTIDISQDGKNDPTWARIAGNICRIFA